MRKTTIKKKLALIVLMQMLFVAFASANGKLPYISGEVRATGGSFIEGATVTIKSSADSSVIKNTLTDKEGKYSFEKVFTGNFFIQVQSLGYKNYTGTVLKQQDPGTTISIPVIVMEPVVKTEAEAVVNATVKKAPFEMKAGKILVNVDASPVNAGMNAHEILEKSPGITMDNDGNISIKGKQGVMVLIDGKPTYMGGTDLINFLKSMPGAQLDQIEIITTPPAKYDAAGNSGIINIKTKKTIIRGANASINLTSGQGRYNRSNGSINVNYRNDKWLVFGMGNLGTNNNYNIMNIERKIFEPGTENLIRTIKNYSHEIRKSNYSAYKAGVDYQMNKQNSLSLVFSGNFNENKVNNLPLSSIYNNQGLMSQLKSESGSTRDFKSGTAALNYRHNFKQKGHELTSDWDYASYNRGSTMQLLTKSYNGQGTQVGTPVLLNGDMPSTIEIISGKADYVFPSKTGWTLQAGAKASWVKTDSKVDYNRQQHGQWYKDDRSNHFLYDEEISAVYASVNKQFKNIDINFGLRGENTVSKGHQVINDSSFTRRYFNLFPTVGMGVRFNDKNSANFSYGRRISRPNYEDLNPFTMFIDSLTYGKGNPFLLPQFTHNLEVGYSWANIINATVNYTHTNDIITQLIKQDVENNLAYQMVENVNSMKQWGLALMSNIPIKKWWRANIYWNGSRNSYSGYYNNMPMAVTTYNMTVNAGNNFTFKKGWTADVSGWYVSRSTEGLIVINNVGLVNLGVGKQILKAKGNIKLSVRDAFYTQNFKGFVKYGDVDMNIRGYRDSRQVALSFTYKFGKNNIGQQKQRNSAAADEQNRVGGN